MAKKRVRSAKQLANDERLRNKKAPAQPTAPSEIEELKAMVGNLLQEINTLKADKNPDVTPQAALYTTGQMQGINLGANGIQGIQYKYPIDKGYYPDPTDALYDEVTLSRYNLKENYVFKWDVEGINYEKANINYAEPKFTVELYRKLYNDDNSFSGKIVMVSRHIQHEDELVSRIACDRLGYKIGPGEKFETFEDMMHFTRVARIRDWLLQLFTPAKITSHKRKKTEMVIDGKIVDVYDTEELTTEETAESAASAVEQQVRY